MKQCKYIRRFTAVLLCALLVLSGAQTALAVSGESIQSAAPAYVSESTEKAVWLDGCSTAGVTEIDAVKWYLDDDGIYYFFLPSTADTTALALYHSFDSLTVMGNEVTSGEILTELPLDTIFSIEADGGSYKAMIMKSSGVAAMFLTTESGSMDAINADPDHETEESGQLLLLDSDGTVSYDGELDSIKGRGNTTWRNIEKKPYNIKLPEKESLLGMKASKKWCLLANGQDHSMLRNRVAYDLADEVGLDFSPESRFLDVYANGEYLGSYQITEKVDLGKNNLVSITDLQGDTEDALADAGYDDDIESYNITHSGRRSGYSLPVNPDDITGGYLIEYMTVSEEPCNFTTSRGQQVDLKTVNSIEQVNYIADFVQDMEDALYSDTGYNSKGKHYTEYIDLESAALMYLLQELSLNIDAGISSCFFYKDSDLNGDGKLHAAPVWDFDVAFGNLTTIKDGVTMTSTDSVFAGISMRYNSDYYTIIAQFAQHEDLQQEARRLWNERFLPAFDILNGKTEGTGRLKSLEYYSSILEDSAKMNYTRWDLTDNLLVPAAGTTHESQLNYYLNWLSQRKEFMSALFMDTETSRELALESLAEYKNLFYQEDYTESEWNSFISAYENGVEAINSADTAMSIQQALSNAKSEMRNALGGLYVYFDNSETAWDEVYVYWWGVAGGENPRWPGYLMTECDNDVWKFKLVPGVSNIIFSNGIQTAQTEDLVFIDEPNSVFVPDGENVGYDQTKGDVYVGSWESYYQLGDVDLNGIVNLNDAISIQRHTIALIALEGRAKALADINGDGQVNLSDAILLQKRVIGLIA